MSYAKMMKWNMKRRKGTRQPIIMHTESGFTPSQSFLVKYFQYREESESAGIEPIKCEPYYRLSNREREELLRPTYLS